MQTTAVVTGGSKGIGYSIVEKLLRNGFKVITISRTPGGLLQLNSLFPGQLQMEYADLSDKQAVMAVADKISKSAGTIEMLVNNAGTFLPGSIHKEEEGVFENLMAININSAYYLTRALLPVMMQSGDGYIFNLCSTASITPYLNGGSYCISKHAMLGFSKVLRLEMIPFGIAVSAILPGATYTESWFGTTHPIERFIKPENISEAVWFAWQNRKNCVVEEILIRPFEGDI